MQPSPKNYLPGGSDRFYYEDLKNNFADNLMSPKREIDLEPEAQPNPQSQSQPHSQPQPQSQSLDNIPFTLIQTNIIKNEALLQKTNNLESDEFGNSLYKEQSERNLDTPSNNLKKRGSFFNLFKRTTSAKDKEEMKEKENKEETNTKENLNLLKKLTLFFNQKAPETLEKAISPAFSSTSNINEPKLIEQKKELLPATISKIIYEEATITNEDCEKDEFEKDMIIDQNLFKNKLLRYQYYERLKSVLNNPEEDEFNDINFDSDNEEKEEYSRHFLLTDYYEKEYQKLAEQENENKSSLYTEKKNVFEMIKMYSDGYPLLDLRKKIRFFLRYFSYN